MLKLKYHLLTVALIIAITEIAIAVTNSSPITPTKLGVTVAMSFRVHAYCPLLNVAKEGSSASQETLLLNRNTYAALCISPFILDAVIRHPEVHELSIVRDNPDIVNWLRAHISIKCPQDSMLVQVKLVGDKDNTAEELLTIMKFVKGEFLVKVSQDTTGRRTDRLNLLAKCRKQYRESFVELFAEVQILEAKGKKDSKGEAELILKKGELNALDKLLNTINVVSARVGHVPKTRQ